MYKRSCAILSLALFLMSFFCSCAASGADTPRVKLCDYRAIAITEDAYAMSDEDIDTALDLYAWSLEGVELESGADLTDKLVSQYLGTDSVDSLKRQIISDMVSHRIVESVFTSVLSTSMAAVDVGTEAFTTFYERRLACIDHAAAEQALSREAYLSQVYQQSEAEFRESECTFYAAVCILQALLKQESCDIPQTELASYRDAIAAEYECTTAETELLLTDEEIFYALAEEQVKALIPEWYADEITNAYNAMLTAHALAA